MLKRAGRWEPLSITSTHSIDCSTNTPRKWLFGISIFLEAQHGRPCWRLCFWLPESFGRSPWTTLLSSHPLPSPHHHLLFFTVQSVKEKPWFDSTCRQLNVELDHFGRKTRTLQDIYDLYEKNTPFLDYACTMRSQGAEVAEWSLQKELFTVLISGCFFSCLSAVFSDDFYFITPALEGELVCVQKWCIYTWCRWQAAALKCSVEVTALCPSCWRRKVQEDSRTG